MEQLIPTEKFEQIISQENLGYTLFEIDLSQARNNVEFNFHGNIFQILEISNQAEFSVCFNNLANRYIKIENFSNISGLYYRFFISNPSQPNKRAVIFCGNSYRYTPTWKMDISNNSIQELNSLLQNVVNAVNNLENTLTYDEVVNKLNQVKSAIDIVVGNTDAIKYNTLNIVKPASLYVRTLNIPANTTQLLSDFYNLGKFFGVVNHDSNNSIYVQIGDDSNNRIELEPKTVFDNMTTNPVSEKVYVVNNNSNTVKISYWDKKFI